MSNSIFGIHESALLVRRDRAEVLANNLANADTPNFKARDIDFRQAIHQFSSQSDSRFKPDMHRTNARHLEGFAEPSTSDFLKYRMPTQPSLDGNTVEAHIEKAKFAENAMQYQATLEFIDSRIKSISGALKGE
ncbi:flagellar basal body rod protein FlgB [Thiomicrospira microaerophila]|uniref:flagellar basal body rod protein FlgB n=1 Tax=Thiomicrospira microaerophila TaxID=406020 RepID=UPI002010077F|nr:flagellar basal body rod protein FlgB [Thiomicrospira microaerophila]UQB42659.1 flagellar basal body rod protein FlgB [Thiomicrospira microaerophila]